MLATKFDAREMFKKLPFLERLRNNEKDGIERFFVDKVFITIFFLHCTSKFIDKS